MNSRRAIVVGLILCMGTARGQARPWLDLGVRAALRGAGSHLSLWGGGGAGGAGAHLHPLTIETSPPVWVWATTAQPFLLRDLVNSLGGQVRTFSGDRVGLVVPANALPELTRSDLLSALRIAPFHKYGLNVSVPEVHGDKAFQGTGLKTAYNGLGTIIGFVDSGIDFTHPAFIDPNTQSSRLLFIWDQTDTSSPAHPPTVLSGAAGTEWTQEQLNADLTQGTHLVREVDVDDGGHGTQVAGCAAGNGQGNTNALYRGIAPKADLIMVKTTLNDMDIVSGVQYCFAQARAQQRACVVNLSLGTHVGPHDNSTEAGALIAQQTGPGHIVVAAAGNEGDTLIHAGATQSVSVTENYNIIGDSGTTDLTLDIWAQAGSDLTFGLGGEDTLGNATGSTPSVSTMAAGTVNATIDTGNITPTATVQLLSTPVDPSNGDAHVAVNMTGTLDTSQGSFDLTVSGTGQWDAWITANTGFAQFGSVVQTRHGQPFLPGDDHETVSMPATAGGVIAVGAYCTRTSWPNSLGGTSTSSVTGTVGDIASFSSLGPTRNPTATGPKPDLSAPGLTIVTALSSQVSATPIDIAAGGKYIADAGTSFSAPHVTGTVALLLETNPFMTPAQADTFLRQSARRDAFTGTTANVTFGAGKLDTQGALLAAGSSSANVGNDTSSLICGRAPSGQLSGLLAALVLLPVALVVRLARRRRAAGLLVALLALLASAVTARAAARLDGALRMAIHQGRALPGYRPHSVALRAQHPDEVSVWIRTDDPFPVRDAVLSLGGRIAYVTGAVVGAHLPVSAVSTLSQIAGVRRIDSAPYLHPLLDVSIPDCKADLAQAGTGLPHPFLGDGVVIGIVDTGIDFRHPDFWFVDSNNVTHSRILWIWDQTDKGGPPPAPPPSGSIVTNEGSEFTRPQIEAELGAHPPGVVRESDTDGHGTHVAGIAAGSGVGNRSALYPGVAPDANLIIVKSSLASNDAVAGVQYVFGQARLLKRSAVVNLSLGTQVGPHDDTDPLAQEIEALLIPGDIVVAAAGNSGSDAIHAHGTLTGSSQFFPLVVQGSSQGQLEIWAAVNSNLSIAVGGMDQIPVFAGPTIGISSDSLGQVIDDTVSWAGGATTLNVTLTSDGAIGERHDQHVQVNFISSGPRSDLRPAAGNLDHLDLIVSGTGSFDVWQTLTDPGGTATAVFETTPLIAHTVTHQVGDTSLTITTPAVGPKIIAVGAHTTRNAFTNLLGTTTSTTDTIGAIAPFSSLGPTRAPQFTGVKPNLTAPGDLILSALSSNVTPTVAATDIALGGNFFRDQGTSMASPHVAGAVALLLQQSPLLDEAGAIAALQASATADAFTGAVPNPTFGYGKLNVQQALLSMPVAPTPQTNTFNKSTLLCGGTTPGHPAGSPVGPALLLIPIAMAIAVRRRASRQAGLPELFAR